MPHSFAIFSSCLPIAFWWTLAEVRKRSVSPLYGLSAAERSATGAQNMNAPSKTTKNPRCARLTAVTLPRWMDMCCPRTLDGWFGTSCKDPVNLTVNECKALNGTPLRHHQTDFG